MIFACTLIVLYGLDLLTEMPLWSYEIARLSLTSFFNQAGEGKKIYEKADLAAGSLFRFVKIEALQKPTYAAFVALLDNYTAQENVTEVVSCGPSFIALNSTVPICRVGSRKGRGLNDIVSNIDSRSMVVTSD